MLWARSPLCCSPPAAWLLSLHLAVCFLPPSLPQVGPAQLDLASLESVRGFAEAYRKSGKGLDILVRCAVLYAVLRCAVHAANAEFCNVLCCATGMAPCGVKAGIEAHQQLCCASISQGRCLGFECCKPQSAMLPNHPLTDQQRGRQLLQEELHTGGRGRAVPGQQGVDFTTAFSSHPPACNSLQAQLNAAACCCNMLAELLALSQLLFRSTTWVPMP